MILQGLTCVAWTIDPGASGGSGRKPVRDLPGQAGGTVCLAFLLSSLRVLVTPHMPRPRPFPEPLLSIMQRWGPKGDSGKQKLLPDTQNCFEQTGPSGLGQPLPLLPRGLGSGETAQMPVARCCGSPRRAQLFCEVAFGRGPPPILTPHTPPHPGSPLGVAPTPSPAPRGALLPGPPWRKLSLEIGPHW